MIVNNKYDGFILVNKPVGISSFGVVYKIRKILKDLTGEKYKVGHSGTLDPAASGLLILAIGKSTKQLGMLLKKDKQYAVKMVLGSVSSTDDIEGEITKISDIVPTQDDVKNSIDMFKGDILQSPPVFSAIKIDGQRAYKLARNGHLPNMQPRPVKVIDISNIKYNYPDISFSCEVASGTYIRSLVRDIGQKLLTGAYMSGLVRTSIDKYKLVDATDLDQIGQENLPNLLFGLE